MPTEFVFSTLARARLLLPCLLVLTSCRESSRPPSEAETRPAPPLTLDPDRLLAPVLAAPKDASGTRRVTFLLGDGRVPFHRAQRQLVQFLDAGDEHHRAELFDAAGDSATQIAQISQLLDDPPEVALVQPLVWEEAQPALAELRKQGTVVISIDSLNRPEPRGEVPQADLYTDPAVIGSQAGVIVLRALTRKAEHLGKARPEGRVLTLRGSDDSEWCKQVQQGFIDALRPEPGIVIVHDAPADWRPDNAKARFAEALRLQHHLDAVFAHDDYLAQAAHQAALQHQVRDDLLIVGVNGFPGPEGGLQMIHRQEIDATVQRPWLVDHAWRLVDQLRLEPQVRPELRQPFPPQPVRPADLENHGP